jgi:predicted transcriptional regulator
MGQEAVNRRLSGLVEGGLVEKIERGRYELTAAGEQYLIGGLVVGELECSEH